MLMFLLGMYFGAVAVISPQVLSCYLEGNTKSKAWAIGAVIVLLLWPITMLRATIKRISNRSRA